MTLAQGCHGWPTPDLAAPAGDERGDRDQRDRLRRHDVGQQRALEQAGALHQQGQQHAQHAAEQEPAEREPQREQRAGDDRGPDRPLLRRPRDLRVEQRAEDGPDVRHGRIGGPRQHPDAADAHPVRGHDELDQLPQDHQQHERRDGHRGTAPPRPRDRPGSTWPAVRTPPPRLVKRHDRPRMRLPQDRGRLAPALRHTPRRAHSRRNGLTAQISVPRFRIER